MRGLRSVGLVLALAAVSAAPASTPPPVGDSIDHVSAPKVAHVMSFGIAPAIAQFAVSVASAEAALRIRVTQADSILSDSSAVRRTPTPPDSTLTVTPNARRALF